MSMDFIKSLSKEELSGYNRLSHQEKELIKDSFNGIREVNEQTNEQISIKNIGSIIKMRVMGSLPDKISKRKKLSLHKKPFLTKVDDYIVYYTLVFGKKFSYEIDISVIKEVNTEKGKVYSIMRILEQGKSEFRMHFSKHMVQRYQERLNIKEYNEALKITIHDFFTKKISDEMFNDDFNDSTKSNSIIISTKKGMIFGTFQHKSFFFKTFIPTELLNNKKLNIRKKLEINRSDYDKTIREERDRFVL